MMKNKRTSLLPDSFGFLKDKEQTNSNEASKVLKDIEDSNPEPKLKQLLNSDNLKKKLINLFSLKAKKDIKEDLAAQLPELSPVSAFNSSLFYSFSEQIETSSSSNMELEANFSQLPPSTPKLGRRRGSTIASIPLYSITKDLGNNLTLVQEANSCSPSLYSPNKPMSRTRNNSSVTIATPSPIHSRSTSSTSTDSQVTLPPLEERRLPVISTVPPKEATRKTSFASLGFSDIFKSNKPIHSYSIDITKIDFEMPNKAYGIQTTEQAFDSREDKIAKMMFLSIQKISGSVRNGSFVTPKLFMPAEIWSQSVTLPNLDTKINKLRLLSSHFTKLAYSDLSDLTQVKTELCKLEQAISTIQAETTLVLNKQGQSPYATLNSKTGGAKDRAGRSRANSLSGVNPILGSIKEYSKAIIQFNLACHQLARVYYFIIALTPDDEILKSKPLSIPALKHKLYHTTNFIYHDILSELTQDSLTLLNWYLDGVSNDILS